jgi:hypothetical protein
MVGGWKCSGCSCPLVVAYSEVGDDGLAMAGLGGNRTGHSRDEYGRRATGTRRGSSQQSRADGFQDTLAPRAGAVAVCSWTTIARALSSVLLLVSSCPCPGPAVDEGWSERTSHAPMDSTDSFGFTTIVLAARSSQHLLYSLERTRISAWCLYTHLLLARRSDAFSSRVSMYSFDCT